MKKYSLGVKIIALILFGGIVFFSLNIPHNSLLSSVIGSPSSTLSVNGGTNTEVLRGTNATYTWTSANADLFSGSYQRISGPMNRCGNIGNMPFNTANGNFSNMLSVNGAGCVYRITFTAKNTNTGKIATSSVIVTVVAALSTSTPPPAALTPPPVVATTTPVSDNSTPTAILKFYNTAISPLDVVPGMNMKMDWNGTNATKYTLTIKVISGPMSYAGGSYGPYICGIPLDSTQDVAGNGGGGILIKSGTVGCTYDYIFTAHHEPSGNIATSSFTVVVKDTIPDTQLMTLEQESDHSVLVQGKKYAEIKVGSTYDITWNTKKHVLGDTIQYQSIWGGTADCPSFSPYGNQTNMGKGTWSRIASSNLAGCSYLLAYGGSPSATGNMGITYSFAVIKFIP